MSTTTTTTTPPPWRAIAGRKRAAADRAEQRAADYRRDADELDALADAEDAERAG